ncbi:MAG: hypothetical protein FJ291_19380 [Planctomycetes bacterium]|nr:hypothetical protein [Planctomycetota bacterium]
MRPFRCIKLLVAAGMALGMVACFNTSADARHYTRVNPFKPPKRHGRKPRPAPVAPPLPLPSPTPPAWKPPILPPMPWSVGPVWRPAPLPVTSRSLPVFPRFKK